MRVARTQLVAAVAAGVSWLSTVISGEPNSSVLRRSSRPARLRATRDRSTRGAGCGRGPVGRIMRP